jgi:hypothetical protein
MTDTIIHSGYLTKSPPLKSVDALTLKRWHRRHFVLFKSADHSLSLQYFDDSTPGQPILKGTIRMQDCADVKLEIPTKTYPFAFGLQSESRWYFFAADTRLELESWFAYLKAGIESCTTGVFQPKLPQAQVFGKIEVSHVDQQRSRPTVAGPPKPLLPALVNGTCDRTLGFVWIQHSTSGDFTW